MEILGLHKNNVLHNFEWLTEKHRFKRFFVFFAREEIDWYRIFPLSNINFIHIECTKK